IGIPSPRGTHPSRDRRARRRPAARRGRQAVAPRRALVPRRPALPQRRGDRLIVDERLERYITELFAPEDSILAVIRARHAAPAAGCCAVTGSFAGRWWTTRTIRPERRGCGRSPASPPPIPGSSRPWRRFAPAS